MRDASKTASRYWVFISYSSKDRAWGAWLHRRLENFPIPAEFHDSKVFDGATLGKNLRPIFRDRDELSGSADRERPDRLRRNWAEMAAAYGYEIPQ